LVWPQLATKNHAVALSLLPPPQWGEEDNQNEKAKLVGWDESSLTEWQRQNKTTINNTDKKNMQYTMFSPLDA